MGLFDNFPYTDFHRLNLDWVISKVKALGIKVDSFEHSAMPTGGTTGQALVKKSAEDYDTQWATVVGERGPQGPEGPIGPAGPQGPKGEDGASFKVLGRYDTLEELQQAHPTGTAGDAYAVGDETDNVVYIWDVDLLAWNEIGPIIGPQGPEGPKGDDGEDGTDGVGVPAGGTTGQVLAKASGADYDTEWVTPQTGGSGDISRSILFNNTNLTQAYSGGTYSFPNDMLYPLYIGVVMTEDTTLSTQLEIAPPIVVPTLNDASWSYFMKAPLTPEDTGRICTVTANNITVGQYMTANNATDNTKGIVRSLILIYKKNA